MSDRPDLPRRKSSASENDDAHVKKSGHRKAFHVGAATRNHTRVPSYGKKLNQLGKLTALTASDTKSGSTDQLKNASPRASGLTRSASQKSLSSRRNQSSQELKRIRHGGSSTHLAPNKEKRSHDEPTHKQSGQSSDNIAQAAKAKFSISGDDEDEDEEDVNDEDEIEEKPGEGETPAANGSVQAQDVATKDRLIAEHDATPGRIRELRPPDMALKSESTSPTRPSPLEPFPSMMQGLSQNKPTSGLPAHGDSPFKLLAQPVIRPAAPMLTREAAVSKDIRATDRISSTDAQGGNSQPLTSRFLESPRRANGSQNMIEGSMSRSYTGMEAPRSPKLHKPAPSLNVGATQLVSSSTLGTGTSRTQQKLLLQRASSIYNLDRYEGYQGDREGWERVSKRLPLSSSDQRAEHAHRFTQWAAAVTENASAESIVNGPASCRE
ncbi:hypothetical protein BCR37DRAFT_387835 [Protomyces lactucae-debilis]|uniref:Uncharacterized protein n=1 Tax=Protomyces lactucae-debilis TaxID=2754530 RepID=A0A1Y2FCF5_PROLT|nr:uncharacterized protein BCR37DRAFT_387835 [Protomyces lactucae-debilis]ORY81608.1 hypothetical protein BCR37DRAFT_387835 [Protomyces lactucae-debilis]